MLKFFYGVMNSSKTAQLLMKSYNCSKTQNSYTVLLKPSVDTRPLAETIFSRIGLSSPCVTFTDKDNVMNVLSTIPDYPEYSENKHVYIFIDEVQFCTVAQIDQLRRLAADPSVDVFCYGLKTNFKTQLFKASQRLLEIADEIEEIPHYCACGGRAIVNARFNNGVIVEDGEEIQIGDAEYVPLCYTCYCEAIR